MIATEIQKRLARDARIVFDVGAERGRYSRSYLEMFPDAMVYAFEPAPAAYSTLNEMAENEPRLEAIPAAVLNRVGEVVLNIASADVYTSVLDMLPGWTEYRMVTQITVPAITLDVFCASWNIEKVDVLKIDVQGAELLVLKGAVNLLETGVRVILCELGYLDRYAGQSWHDEIEAFLAGYGYQLEKMIPCYQHGRLMRADGVFAR